MARSVLEGVAYADDAYDGAANGADGRVLVTEYAFRSPDLECIRTAMKSPVFADLRNVYRPREVKAAGFAYHSVGRPVVYDAPDRAKAS